MKASALSAGMSGPAPIIAHSRPGGPWPLGKVRRRKGRVIGDRQWDEAGRALPMSLGRLQGGLSGKGEWDPALHPRGEGGMFGEGGDDGGAHAVGVSDDPNSQSLITKTPGQQASESDAAYNDRIFHEGMERYPPAAALEDAAQRYRESLGLVEPAIDDYRTIQAPLERAQEVGAAFGAARSTPDDPVVQRAYRDLVEQTDDQWHLLTDSKADGGLGIKVDFVSPDQIRAGFGTGIIDPEGLNPYPTAAAQRDDIVNNGHLSIASIADYPGAAHPILSNTRGGEYDTFRAVHDAFGHAAIGADFTRHGELEAWVHHASMFTGEGRQAASTELTGENSYLVTTHEPADHKATLLPDDLVALPLDPAGHFDLNYWPGVVHEFEGKTDQVGGTSSAVGGEAEVVARYGVVNSANALFGKLAKRTAKTKAEPFTPEEKADRQAAAQAFKEKIVEAEDELATILHRWLKRRIGAAAAKVKSERARRHTRHWNPPGTREFKADPALGDEARWRHELETDVEGFLKRLIVRFGNSAGTAIATRLGITLGPDNPAFNAAHKRVSDALRARTVRISDWSEEVAGQIRDRVAEAEAEGLSIRAISQRILDIVDGEGMGWAERIARTEVTGAANAAALEAADQSGVVTHKQWLATPDERTRESHALADGDIVPIDEPFQVGDSLLDHPGDPNSDDPGEVVNCRCTMLLLIKNPDGEDVEVDAGDEGDG